MQVVAEQKQCRACGSPGPFNVRQAVCVTCSTTKRRDWVRAHRARQIILNSNSNARAYGHAPIRADETWLSDFIGRHDKRCDVCRKDISAPGTNGRIAYRVDHSHKTGAVRGLLCNRCNAIMGHFDNDPALLGRMQEYLISAAA